NWQRDPSLIKASARAESTCPEFPDSEWSNLFRGKPIDFDAVITSTHTLDYDQKQSIKLGSGSAEIRFGSRTPAKKVRDHGTWVICWEMFREIVLFTMPWRDRELSTYHKYLTGLFKAYEPSQHPNIINFDKAVQQRVSNRHAVDTVKLL
ncbi:hypothetical protein K435DRAFT_663491, partial [Dendrothele bispora CBS 962.96]